MLTSFEGNVVYCTLLWIEDGWVQLIRRVGRRSNEKEEGFLIDRVHFSLLDRFVVSISRLEGMR